MGRKNNNMAKLLLVAILASTGGVAGYMAWMYFTQPQSSLSPATFSVVPLDYNAGVDLPLSGFDYTLRGLPVGEAASDTLAWAVIETGTTLESLTSSDLDTTLYSQFALEYNGTVAQTDDAFDDAFGTRTYPRREKALTPGVANVLEAVATPATEVMEIRNLITLAAVTNCTATPIAGQTNVTFVLMVSATYPDCAYEDFWSYIANANVAPTITLTYNGTVTTSTALYINGWTMTRLSATQMVYTVSKVSGIQSWEARWGSSATVALGITAAAFSFDGTDHATNP